MDYKERKTLAYIVGVALGDGNLSNPNGRAIRLRITCDARYPHLAQDIATSLKVLLPRNKISIVRGPISTYFNISVYSNKLSQWMPWRVGQGPKESQHAHVPRWIRARRSYARECLRGLLQTDGSVYKDRGYLMVNFCNNIATLAQDVHAILQNLGYKPTITSTPAKEKTKYTVRVARDAIKLIDELRLHKT